MYRDMKVQLHQSLTSPFYGREWLDLWLCSRGESHRYRLESKTS